MKRLGVVGLLMSAALVAACGDTPSTAPADSSSPGSSETSPPATETTTGGTSETGTTVSYPLADQFDFSVGEVCVAPTELVELTLINNSDAANYFSYWGVLTRQSDGFEYSARLEPGAAVLRPELAGSTSTITAELAGFVEPGGLGQLELAAPDVEGEYGLVVFGTTLVFRLAVVVSADCP